MNCSRALVFLVSTHTANLLNCTTGEIGGGGELHLASDLQVPRGKGLFRENLTFGDCGNEVLRPAHFELQALPHLGLGQGRGGAGLVDGRGVGDVKSNHFCRCWVFLKKEKGLETNEDDEKMLCMYELEAKINFCFCCRGGA